LLKVTSSQNGLQTFLETQMFSKKKEKS